jgi:large subunit ribosomal protein L15e
MFTKHMRDLWKRPKENLGEGWKTMLISIRKEPVICRVTKPTRPDRARSLGYKAKKGHVVVRIRVLKGKRKTPKKGRRSPRASGRFFTTGLSAKTIAEQRASRKFPNLEVMNSYLLAEDGAHKWFEVLMTDACRAEVSKDMERKFMAGKSQSGRAFRGKTSSGRKSRGLMRKGKGTEKIRPSIRAKGGRGK